MANLDTLIADLDDSLKNWDAAYTKIIGDAEAQGIKMTEEKLRVAVRNWMRGDNQIIPEIARWFLRAALGGVEGHE